MRNEATIVNSRPLVLFFLFLTFTPAIPSAHAKEQTDSEPNLLYVDAQPLTLILKNDRTLSTSIAVRNVGTRVARVEFCTLLEGQSTRGCVSNVNVTEANRQLSKGEVAQFSIRMVSVQAPVSGYLGVVTYNLEGKNIGTSFRRFIVSVPLFPNISWCPIGVGFIAAALLFSFSAARLSAARILLIARMGSPEWDFSKSWASNITIAGALLSIGLSLAAVPEQTHYMNRAGYTVLNLLFALLAGLAPFSFNVFRRAVLDGGGANGQPLDYQGYVICFLIAGGITFWAVTAQMITLAIIVNEISAAGIAPGALTRTFQAVIALLELGITLYAAQTIYWTAKSQMIQREKALATIASASGLSTEQLKKVHPPLSGWAPL